MQFVDQHMNVFVVGTRLTQAGWKSAFSLTKPRPAATSPAGTASCESRLSGV
jgi:hypothetical protein